MVRHSDSLILVWKLAELEARHGQSPAIDPAHFFLGLLKVVELDVARLAETWQAEGRDSIERICGDIANVRAVLTGADIDTTVLRRRLRRRLGPGTAKEGDRVSRSDASREAFRVAEAMGGDTVLPNHLLAAIVELAIPEVLRVLSDSGVDPQRLLRNAKLAALASAEDPHIYSEAEKARRSYLTSIGRDLTGLAAKGKLQPVIGRKDEIRRLAQILLQSRKSNVILTGEAGVGKTGIVEAFAQIIVSGAVTDEFRGFRIIEISMSSIVAGTTFRGDFEARLTSLIKEASADPKLVLFIDEIHLLVGAGQSGQGAMDAANLLKPALARGEIRVIGATTTTEYRRFIAKDPALERRFQTLHVAEPSTTECLEILVGLQARLEKHHNVTIATDALEAAVDLSMRHIPDRRLPDKAIDLIDQACAQARLQSLTSIRNPTPAHIDRTHVAGLVSKLCGVPVSKLTSAEKEQFLRMEEHLRRRVKGQDAALTSVADAIRMAKSGLRNSSKPVAVFLLAGPSGSGKTELAKAVAEFLFGDGAKLVRFDMSEFMEEHAIAKLIGAPPGYVGHDEGGQLTEKIRNSPYAVLLLDEIEKAHPKILDIFLQVFDEGVLTDAKGYKCDFRETVIFLTSNLGVVAAPVRRLGFRSDEHGEERSPTNARVAITKAFRPELINRLSEIIVFNTLDRSAVHEIIDKFVARLNERLRSQEVIVELDDDAREFLLERGFDERFGAREMERTIEAAIAKPLSNDILNNRLHPGTSIRVTVISGELRMSRT